MLRAQPGSDVVIDRTPATDPEALIWAALAEVPDPEIPTISVVDLGVIGSVELAEDRSACGWS